MKQIASLITVLMTASSLFGETIQMAPLCEECPKILHYRMLFMEDDIMHLEDRVFALQGVVEESQYKELMWLVTRMKYHIGFPVEMEDMEFPR